MKWADAESVPDMETGWPGNRILSEAGLAASTGTRLACTGDLDAAQFDRDLNSALIEKATGTVHTRVLNSIPKGGVSPTLMYTATLRKHRDWACRPRQGS